MTNENDFESNKNNGIEKNYVPENTVKKVIEVLSIKQPKGSYIYVQQAVEKIMDNFFGKLKSISNKQKISEEDIRDLIIRDEIEYLKDVIEEEKIN